MATIGDLWVNLNADTGNFDRGMSQASNKATGFGGVMKSVASTVAGFLVYDVGKKLVSGFVDATKAGIDYNATLETSRIKWETLLGTQEKANKMLKDIEKFAATTPFEKMGVEAMATQLFNAGFQGQALFDQLTKFGDMAGAFGVQQASLEEMVRQYSQVKQAGVAYTEDLNILQDRGIPIYKAIAKELGINVSEVKKWASEGKISADIYQNALDGIAKGVEGGMQKQSQSFSGMLSTLKDNMNAMAGVLSQPIFDFLKTQLQNVLPFIDKISASLSENGLMGTIQRFAPGIMPFVQLALGIFQTMGDTVGTIIQSMTSFWNEHASWLKPLIVGLLTFVATFISNTITAIGAVVQSGLAIIDGIINFFQNLFKGNFSGCWESIKQIFSNAITFIWNLMQVNFATNLPGMIKNFGKNFKTYIDDAWIAVKNFFKGGADDVVNFAKQGFSNCYNAVREWMSKVPQTVTQFMNDAISFLKGLPTRFTQMGKDMIQGLINGIKSMASNVVGAIGNVVDSAVKGAKKALGIASPSKVFRQIGVYTGEGLVEGLVEGSENSVLKASRSLANNVIGGYKANLSTNISGTTGNGSSGSNSTTNNITINASRPLSPAETVRELERTQKRLALGF